MWPQPLGLCILVFIAGMSWRRQPVETCSPAPAAERARAAARDAAIEQCSRAQVERAAVANGATALHSAAKQEVILHVAGANGYRFQVKRIAANRFQVKRIAANGTVEEKTLHLPPAERAAVVPPQLPQLSAARTACNRRRRHRRRDKQH